MSTKSETNDVKATSVISNKSGNEESKQHEAPVLTTVVDDYSRIDGA